MMGFLPGLFAGMAYQAPMLACQLFFPDRKQLVGFLLLTGLAAGIVTYSGVTQIWAARCDLEAGCGDLSMILRNLSYCLFGHSIIASIFLSSPQKHMNSDELRRLQYNLLNLH